MGDFQPGWLVPVSWQSAGQAAAGQLNVKDHNLEISVLLHDVTGVKSQGFRARISGPQDMSGRVVCDLDLDEVPWQAPLLVLPGFGGVFGYGISRNQAIQVPMICEKLHFAGGTDKEMMWDADWKANSLMGLMVYPAL